ncbi:unnamed protein product [Ophioblennius macclurei]
MYGWIVDGFSSLFEPVSGQNPIEWSSHGHVNGEIPGVNAGPRRQEGGNRPAKRSYQSVYVADSVSQSDQVEVKRPRRDVVISFLKKTVAGVAGLLGLRRSQKTKYSKHLRHEDTRPVTLLGIDELHTSQSNIPEWRMDKPIGGVSERGGKNLFQRNYSVSAPPTGLPERGNEGERRGSLQLLPTRPAVRIGASNSDPIHNGFGHGRCAKPSLTVEETIKQNDKEHYRRLLEMVSDKYSKSQPLPFHQTKPQEKPLSQVDHKTAASGKPFDSVPRKMGHIATPNTFTWKNRSAPKDRRSLTFTKPVSGTFEDVQPVRCTKQKQTADLDLSTEVATRLNLVDRDPAAVRTPDTHFAHTRHSDEEIPRMTKEMAAEVSAALSQSDPNLVLSAAFKLRITQRDLATLQEGGWLNDEVMNFYFSLVMERCCGEAEHLRVYSFSTFFFPKLQGGGGGQPGGHGAVKRWTKSVDLFQFDLILVPLHLGVHWALAVIDFKSKMVKSFDSMGQRHDDICSLLLLYLKEEHKAKKGRELDNANWTVRSFRASEIPQQKNGSDCGVFACKYADYIARGRPLTFKQCHMPLFRKLMMWEILNKKLL